ncbi:hypothetical protein QQF64_029724 [Cirrhinus molitorella]|uniref:Uncharacterized protein n=1 Tax=Cirrhinus molitorella TaxID=172907 RepID=A0ABR3N1B6_9TELE
MSGRASQLSASPGYGQRESVCVCVWETDGRELVDQCHSPSSMPKSQHKHTINCFLSYPCSVLSPRGRAINTAYVTFLKVLSKEL